MRPVNLIPPEERRGERGPLRAGLTSYGIVAGLLVLLVAVTAYVITGNSVREREAERADLEAQLEVATQRAEAVRGYAEFAAVEQNRTATVGDLARSRFDWERVLRELARVLPEEVWLTRVSGTVSPEVTVQGAPTIAIRASVPGPALSVVGCVESQDEVGALVNALEDIDGVTRVTVATSERDEAGTFDQSASGDDCRTRPGIARFEVVAAFDEVQIDPTSGALVPLPEPVAPSDEGAVAAAHGDAPGSAAPPAPAAAQQGDGASIAPGTITGSGR